MEYPQVDYGVINHEADCWDAHSQFLAWVRIRDPMLPKVSNRYCNFECFASSEIWHILHQRLYWQRFKHSWILGTTNSFSQYNSISEFGTRLFPFFHIPTVRYFELMPLALSEAGMDGRSIFPTLVPENGCGFFVGCLPNGTPELRSNFQRYFLLADFSGFRKVRGLR
jgi:hypothetical protein